MSTRAASPASGAFPSEARARWLACFPPESTRLWRSGALRAAAPSASACISRAGRRRPMPPSSWSTTSRMCSRRQAASRASTLSPSATISARLPFQHPPSCALSCTAASCSASLSVSLTTSMRRPSSRVRASGRSPRRHSTTSGRRTTPCRFRCSARSSAPTSLRLLRNRSNWGRSPSRHRTRRIVARSSCRATPRRTRT